MEQRQVETKLTAAEIESELAQCIGSEEYHRHSLSGLLFTDGVQTMAEICGAYWLIDVVASYQAKLQKSAVDFPYHDSLQDFQLWDLEVKDRKGVVTCRADSDCKPVLCQVIEHTDFPLERIKLYVEGGVLLLPSEH